MKKLIAFPLAWSLYYIGDLFSHRAMMGETAIIYHIYNWCMCNSLLVQEWAKLDSPWKKEEF